MTHVQYIKQQCARSLFAHTQFLQRNVFVKIGWNTGEWISHSTALQARFVRHAYDFNRLQLTHFFFLELAQRQTTKLEFRIPPFIGRRKADPSHKNNEWKRLRVCKYKRAMHGKIDNTIYEMKTQPEKRVSDRFRGREFTISLPSVAGGDWRHSKYRLTIVLLLEFHLRYFY